MEEFYMYNFKKISTEELKKSKSYVVTTAILNMKKEFTVEEICDKIRKKLQTQYEKELDIDNYALEKLYMLRDNGMVIEHGSYFTVKEYVK